MKKYSLIKITDNNDHRNFIIDYTTMKDYRARVSILYSKYVSHCYGKGVYRPVFSILDKDWSAYCVQKKCFCNLTDVNTYRDELTELYAAKLEGYCPNRSLSFK